MTPHEIIIVDDASNDGSQALIEQYCERYPHLIRSICHSRNLGIARSRIDALNAVTGDYVTYVDGDDRFLTDKLEHELATLAANPDADLVYSNFYFIDTDGTRTALWAEDTDSVYTGWIFPHVFARNFPKRTLFRNELVSCAALRRAGFHDPQLALFEDFELRIRLTLSVQAAYCDRPLAEYRRHSGSLSHHDLRGHMAALDYIYEKDAELLAALEPGIRAQVTQAYQEWVTHTFLAPVERGIAAAGATQLDTTYGEHLIFLLGLPWSGATLLQHALNRHTQIHALNEADILLPVIDLVNAPDATPRMAGLRRFLDTLPEGVTAYLEYARQFASGLYRQALAQTGKTLCLDRTSSYADQFAEIRRLFPKARFVVLLRHPGAVLETALNARSTGIDSNRADGMPFDDMECLPARLLQCVRALGTDAIVVRYEDMIAEPETALRRLCARLGIGAEPAMFELAAQFKQFGTDDAPQQDAWIERVSVNGLAPQVREYLEGLGAATVEGLGYTYATAVERLSSATGCAFAAVNTRMAKTVVTDGERRFAEGDLDTAEQLFHAALDLDASNTDALNNLGVLHWERGDTATALEYLARGLSVAPGDRSIVTNTTTVLHALGNTEDAVALCRGYLEKHPDDVDLRTLLDTIKTDLHSQDGFRQAH